MEGVMQKFYEVLQIDLDLEALLEERDTRGLGVMIIGFLGRPCLHLPLSGVITSLYRKYPDTKNILKSARVGGLNTTAVIQKYDTGNQLRWNSGASAEKLVAFSAYAAPETRESSGDEEDDEEEELFTFEEFKRNKQQRAQIVKAEKSIEVAIEQQPIVSALDHFARINEDVSSAVVEGVHADVDGSKTDAQFDAVEEKVSEDKEGTEHFESFFEMSQKPLDDDSVISESTLVLRSQAKRLCEYGRLGDLIEGSIDERNSSTMEHQVLLNVNDPFCAVALGVQGSGKSHTIATIIENCTMQAPPLIRLKAPMPVLVFHYDKTVTNPCECASLVLPSVALKNHMTKVSSTLTSPRNRSPTIEGVKQMIVLVSPTYYRQRKDMYNTLPNTTVRPLLLNWDLLKAGQLKTLMGIQPGDTQLYMGVMLNRLRQFQKDKTLPSFRDFKEEIMKEFPAASQSGPLQQRLNLLETIVFESDYYTAKDKEEGYDQSIRMNELVEPGTVIITDLTDPMLDANSANGIFQVLLEQFRDTPVDGKLVVFDEAHKYLSSTKSAALVDSIVDTVRQMRHYGLRVAISTQSPLALPAEVLELTSLAICHRFHSRDWFRHLAQKIPLPAASFEAIQLLKTGEAIVFAGKNSLSRRQVRHTHRVNVDPRNQYDDEGDGFNNMYIYNKEFGVKTDTTTTTPETVAPNKVFKIQIRNRLTMDGGASQTNFKPKALSQNTCVRREKTTTTDQPITTDQAITTADQVITTADQAITTDDATETRGWLGGWL
eukprot:m.121370 g.121370  ORF g.121370 m.121370 type:complete len:771 (+) comp28849_c0_seq1:141-2453(+)